MFHRTFVIFALVASLAWPSLTLAADEATTETTTGVNTSIYTNDLGTTLTAAEITGSEASLTVIIRTLIQALLSVLGIIFLVLVIYAGLLWMTAAGNEDKVKKAQKLLRDGVIGLIIILSSYTIANTVLTYLGTRVY